MQSYEYYSSPIDFTMCFVLFSGDSLISYCQWVIESAPRSIWSMLCCGGAEEDTSGPPANQYTAPSRGGNSYGGGGGNVFIFIYSIRWLLFAPLKLIRIPSCIPIYRELSSSSVFSSVSNSGSQRATIIQLSFPYIWFFITSFPFYLEGFNINVFAFIAKRSIESSLNL
jgi:hypothetical protein